MVFSSNLFLLKFLPVFLLAFFISPRKYRNVVTLIASFVFYVWGAPKFIFLLLGSLYLDYYLVRFIHLSEGRARKGFLAASVVLNLLLLLFFKYSNFFIDNVNLLLSGFERPTIEWIRIGLPIGISFITFHKLTYAIDTYRRLHNPLDDFSDYLLYIMMFPHQIAGPIVRFSEIAYQIEDKEREVSNDMRLQGMFRFIEGLGRKVILANPLGEMADQVFAMDTNDISSPIAWVGILAYTFQIYFDFSGYSDMGIGLARMIGFVFPENFNFPYVSESITEFWRRWHITLGRFMRDYLYIPLGGNKVSTGRMYLNLWIVFLVSGLWHGASWTFVVWGAYHGFILILDRLFLLKVYARLGRFFSIPFTFLLTVIGWVFFRADNLNQAYSFIGKMFSFDSGMSVNLDQRFLVVFLLSVLISFYPLYRPLFAKRMADYERPSLLILRSFALVILLLWSISEINSSGFNPFIYYRF